MIVKGKARSGPAQLAAYLMRSDEHAVILDPGIGEDNLYRDFMTWHVAGEATQGEKTLYHAQIAPEARYKMSKEECLRAVEILADELGMKNHPRRAVLHQGDGQPHIHVVFQRTNLDTMTLWDDSFNYVKHERASQRMALEFGHELVPGKHANRDRKKQKDFPRQKLTQAEAQYEKRTGLSKEERVKQISALRAASDNGLAFKAALEEAGYVLAQGKRGYVVVDQAGGHSVLTRNTGLKKKELEAFMAGVELDKLPTIEEAQALQKQRAEQAEKPAPELSAEASQFLQPPPAQVETPAPQPQPAGAEASKFLQPEEAPAQPVVPPEAPTPRQEPEIEGAKKAREERGPQPVDPERKQRIIALRAWADGAQAFKKSLEEAGYTLARGSTGYVLFSEDGIFSLARHAGLSKAKLDAFMSPIPLDSLPRVDELIDARKQARQKSKLLAAGPEAPPAPLPPAKDTGLDLATRMEISALDMAAEAIAEAQRQARDFELDALRKAIAKRQEEEAAALRERHEAELRAKEVELDRKIALDMDVYTRNQDKETEAFLKAREQERTGIKAIIRAIENRWNPALGAARAQERDRELQNFYRRRAKERDDYEALILQSKQLEIENLKERQALQMHDQQHRHGEEAERYIREHEEAKRILAELQEQRREREEELERNDSLRDGPPPPKLGK